jgi:hypothetical protein
MPLEHYMNLSPCSFVDKSINIFRFFLFTVTVIENRVIIRND